jgi:hypothetical protein
MECWDHSINRGEDRDTEGNGHEASACAQRKAISE